MTGSKAKPSKAALAGGFALPKRSATSSPPPDAVDAFIRGETAAPSSAATPHKSKRVVTRQDGREVRRVTVYIAADVAKRLALRCAEEDRDMSGVVNEALSEYLAR